MTSNSLSKQQQLILLLLANGEDVSNRQTADLEALEQLGLIVNNKLTKLGMSIVEDPSRFVVKYQVYSNGNSGKLEAMISCASRKYLEALIYSIINTGRLRDIGSKTAKVLATHLSKTIDTHRQFAPPKQRLKAYKSDVTKAVSKLSVVTEQMLEQARLQNKNELLVTPEPTEQEYEIIVSDVTQFGEALMRTTVHKLF
jgi:hypothetical protein